MIKKFVKWFIYGPLRKLCYKIFIKEITGIKNLPKTGRFILAANHTSYLDIVVLSTVLLTTRSIGIRYLAKKELFISPLSKWFFSIGDPIPIDRKAKGQIALQEAIKALKKGDVIGIYPEGERSLTGKIQKGKTGVTRLALWSKVPVIPVGIKGTFELMPLGKAIPKFKKSVILNIGKPIYFDKYYDKKITKKLLRKLTDNLMKKITKLCEQRYNP